MKTVNLWPLSFAEHKIPKNGVKRRTISVAINIFWIKNKLQTVLKYFCKNTRYNCKNTPLKMIQQKTMAIIITKHELHEKHTSKNNMESVAKRWSRLEYLWDKNGHACKWNYY